MTAVIDSDVSVVIEEEVFEEQDLLIRRLTPYATMRPQDLQSLRLGDGNVWTNHFEDLLLDRFTSKYPENGISEEEEHTNFRTNSKEPTSRNVVVNGSENNDVPAEYLVKGLKPHELPVIGVYVHRQISPGFPYLVRYNNSQRYLFNGEARCLKSIGMGYGKRLTFAGDTPNDDCVFWSDSHPEGFAFSLVAVQGNQKFVIYTAQMEAVGEVLVESIMDEQEEESTECVNVAITKYVHVRMECSIKYYQRNHGLLELRHNDVESINGLAVLVKHKGEKRANLKCIQNVILSRFGKCSLYKDC
ncbi:uncharacterized protein LOC126810549 [Patella vulgata]|uniref:uncharacterized protein LOC126810549 n=1 Tax=Patella vulgata TaxID=6465 RepID=UPI0024A99FD6|nr:uncharacterized protein LOC126810549 [Patella vulgata]